MYVLGISAYWPGAAACLLRDGELVAAVEEERFRRIRHWAGLPTEAIAYCLAAADVDPRDLDHIGISPGRPRSRTKRGLRLPWARRGSELPEAGLGCLEAPPADLIEVLQLDSPHVRAQCHTVTHPYAQLASAYFTSPLQDAAVVSIDDAADGVSTAWGVGHDHQLQMLGTIEAAHSLGRFAEAMSQWLGLTCYGDDRKLASLAPYGEARFLDQMHRIVRLQRDGTFELDLDLFARAEEGHFQVDERGAPTPTVRYSDRLVTMLGTPRDPGQRETSSAVPGFTQFQIDMAASAQAMLESAELHLLRMVRRATGRHPLCLGGRLALNRRFNGRLHHLSAFEELSIAPGPGDASAAIGAAYFIYHHLLGKPRGSALEHPYLGPSYGNDEIEHFLHGYGVPSKRLPEEKLYLHIAHLLAEGALVGWFQGRMEWGPYALGNRSLLGDPRRMEVRDLLQARAERADRIVPLGASVLHEVAGELFDVNEPDPFMLRTRVARPEVQPYIPAAVSPDGTLCAQTVDPVINPRYAALIDAFADETGIPLLLNTSFNESEPIVCDPEQAIQSFARNYMDALVLGNHLIVKP
jgi:carbamoyltransferase